MTTSIEALAPRLRAICGAAQRHHRPAGAAHLRVRRADLAPRASRAGGAAERRPRRWLRSSRACAAAGVPFVARGSGTGLSGGARPALRRAC